MRIVSWNVNGIRAVAKKGFRKFLDDSGADVVAVQEARASLDQFPDDLAAPAGWHVHVEVAKKAGYSGVALFSKRKADEYVPGLGEKKFDDEGRLQMARFGKVLVVNGYFPNGNGTDRDNSRVPYKLAFYKSLHKKLEAARKAGDAILVMGDFNTAHEEIDLARPKENVKTSGFLPEERAELDRWFRTGWTDTFRHFEKSPGHYTWWSQRGGARARNVGWRIDYVAASEGAMSRVTKGFIWKDIAGSDHCPIGVELSGR